MVMHPSDMNIDSKEFAEWFSSSYAHLLKLIEEKKISTGSRADGNPKDNEILLQIMNKHKRGFFENIHKLIIRASHESVESLEILWDSHLIGFQSIESGEQYTCSKTGSLADFFFQIEKIT